jgi:hypothetical protein
MIVVYVILAMAFFKVFPEFAFPIGTTAFGCFMMAMFSGAVMFGTTLTANLRGIRWISTGAKGLPWDVFFVCAFGIVLAYLVAWLVGVGFSSRFFEWARSYRGDPFWVSVMLMLPPIVHATIVCLDILKLGRQARGD